MRRIEGLRIRLVLHKWEEKEIDGKRNKGRKPFYVKVCSIDRKGLGITIC